jgi:glycosyltransferase involved in cell wall biosynthesis
MVGRLADGKGHEVLLDAVRLMDDFEGSVCITGDGPLYDSLEESIEKQGLSEKVFLTGYRDDVPRILAASDVLVLPSFREGAPRVITEAMASGLPVVATEIAGIPEQVDDGESGFLIPTGDARALAQRLEQLLGNDELREKMGEQGLEHVEPFSVDAMLRDTDREYQKLLNG